MFNGIGEIAPTSLTFDNNTITNIPNPINNNDIVNKFYVDSALSNIENTTIAALKSGNLMTDLADDNIISLISGISSWGQCFITSDTSTLLLPDTIFIFNNDQFYNLGSL
jgi:hypothetical protein